MTFGDAVNVASGLGGAGFGGKILLHWMAKEHNLRTIEAKRNRDQALDFTNDRWKALAGSLEEVGGWIMALFAAVACFTLLSTIILPYFAPTNVTVYLPRSLDLWVMELERLKKIELVSIPHEKGQTVRQILILPIHFAFCTNIVGFWVADQGLRR